VLSEAGKPIFESFSGNACSRNIRRGLEHAGPGGKDESAISSLCALIQATMVNVQGYIYENSTDGAVACEDNNDNSTVVLRSDQSIIYAVIHGPLIFAAVQYIDVEHRSTNRCPKEDESGMVSPDTSLTSHCWHTESYMKLILEYLYAQILFTLTDQVKTILEQNANFDVRGMLGPDTETLMHGIINQARDSDECANLLTSSVQVVALEPSVREYIYCTLRENVHGALYALLLSENRIVCFIQPKQYDLQLKSCDIHLILNFVKHQSAALSKTESWLPMCLPRFNASGSLFVYSNFLHPESKMSLLLLSAQNDTCQFNSFHNSFGIIRERFRLNDIDNEGCLSSQVLNDVNRSSKEAHDSLMRGYCLIENVNHFMFRRDISIPSSCSNGSGNFTQNLSFSLDDGTSGKLSRQRVWIMYENLALRLRYVQCNNSCLKGNEYFSAQILFESIPVGDDLVSYIEDNANLYMGIRGNGYELYATFTGNVSIIEGEKHCQRLVERLIADEDTLYITKNCTWNS